MIMKRYLFIVVALLPLMVLAQMVEPVKWSAAAMNFLIKS